MAKLSITQQIEQQIRDAGLTPAPDWFVRFIAKQCRIRWSEYGQRNMRYRRMYTMAVLYRVWCGVDAGDIAPANKAIAGWLNQNGITTQTGNRWTRATIAVTLSQYGLSRNLIVYQTPWNRAWREFMSVHK